MVWGVFQTGRKLDELAPGEIAFLILDSISDHWFYGESPQDIFSLLLALFTWISTQVICFLRKWFQLDLYRHKMPIYHTVVWLPLNRSNEGKKEKAISDLIWSKNQWVNLKAAIIEMHLDKKTEPCQRKSVWFGDKFEKKKKKSVEYFWNCLLFQLQTTTLWHQCWEPRRNLANPRPQSSLCLADKSREDSTRIWPRWGAPLTDPFY